MDIESAEYIGNLEAVSIIGLILKGDGAGVAVMLEESEDPVELAHAACSVAVSLLVTLAPGREEWILEGLRRMVLEGLEGPAGGS